MRLFCLIFLGCSWLLTPLQASELDVDVSMDELLARSLALVSFEEQPQVIYSPEWFRAAEEIRPLVQKYNEIASAHKVNGIDVHRFNGLYDWKTNLAKLVAVDDKIFKSNPNLPLETVISELRKTKEYQWLDQKVRGVLEANLERLLGYVQKQPVEASETHCHVPQLFSRVWSLITMSQEPEWLELMNPSEEIQAFMFFINENSLEGGGCYQGYAGRICRNYLVLVKKLLGLESLG